LGFLPCNREAKETLKGTALNTVAAAAVPKNLRLEILEFFIYFNLSEICAEIFQFFVF
jgi:hypothetical protein